MPPVVYRDMMGRFAVRYNKLSSLSRNIALEASMC